MNKPLESFERIEVERAVFQRSTADPLDLSGSEVEDRQDHLPHVAADLIVDIFDQPENQMLKPQFDRLRLQIDQIGTDLE